MNKNVKVFRVEIELSNTNFYSDHCVYVGTDYKKALEAYKKARKEYKEISMIYYMAEVDEDGEVDYDNENLTSGNTTDIYYYNANRK